MASTHLKTQLQMLDNQMQNEINSVTANYQQQINQLENSRPKYDPVGKSVGGLIVTAVILAFFTAGISLLVLVAILFCMKAMNTSQRESVDEKNRQIDGQIRNLTRERDAKLSETRKQYTGKKNQTETAFKAKVKASRIKYGQKTNSKPIVDWLVDRFVAQIHAIDRSPHIKQLTTTFSFRVDSSQICTLHYASSYGSTSGSYGDAHIFDLTKNLFTHLNDFEDRVGFSQAMAKFVQFEITKRFPKDPLAPCAVAPVVNITSDDETMYLCYTVPNGKYQHATKL